MISSRPIRIIISILVGALLLCIPFEILYCPTDYSSAYTDQVSQELIDTYFPTEKVYCGGILFELTGTIIQKLPSDTIGPAIGSYPNKNIFATQYLVSNLALFTLGTGVTYVLLGKLKKSGLKE